MKRTLAGLACCASRHAPARHSAAPAHQHRCWTTRLGVLKALVRRRHKIQHERGMSGEVLAQLAKERRAGCGLYIGLPMNSNKSVSSKASIAACYSGTEVRLCTSTPAVIAPPGWGPAGAGGVTGRRWQPSPWLACPSSLPQPQLAARSGEGKLADGRLADRVAWSTRRRRCWTWCARAWA
jgi:hypothetical protein